VLLDWLSLRASLPQLEGEFSASGLSTVATIQRDAADHSEWVKDKPSPFLSFKIEYMLTLIPFKR
jgi:hypothetical protein